ncbi:ATP-NAD kinase-like domain-containing protein [Phellopilus nigrolimitatus]|nr:ATP-NAD kinase-like domain-containing protein [Phellopilus nigrolimitatus]
MSSPLLLISNPKCGDERGQSFVQEHVIPLLADHGLSISKTVVTNAPGHAGEEVLRFLDEHKKYTAVSLILSSGDGTLHEIVNAVHSVGYATFQRPIMLSIALVPNGTANALYSSLFPPVQSERDSATYKLQSLISLIENRQNLAPLTIAKTVIRSSDAYMATVFSAVVTSTSLHASILYDSENLRSDIPDLSRFKIAASNNITRWYHSDVIFRPTEGGDVSMYDYRENKFVRYTGDETHSTQFTMEGPFAYFLSTVNVDRLEPSFIISPLHSEFRPEVGSMDIVIIRPARDPTKPEDSEQGRTSFSEKTGLVLGAAYRAGAHIMLGYANDGTISEGEKSLRSVVEYVRCGGWDWVPKHCDEAAQLLCADGSIWKIGTGGKATCSILKAGDLSFRIYV